MWVQANLFNCHLNYIPNLQDYQYLTHFYYPPPPVLKTPLISPHLIPSSLTRESANCWATSDRKQVIKVGLQGSTDLFLRVLLETRKRRTGSLSLYWFRFRRANRSQHNMKFSGSSYPFSVKFFKWLVFYF